MLNWITPEQTLVMMRAVNYKLFRTINHSEELVEYIYRFPLLQSTRDKLGMLSAGNWECFSNAVSEGHFDLAKKLWTWAGQVSPSGKRDILAANDFRAFKNAARGGHLDLMRWIWLQGEGNERERERERNSLARFHFQFESFIHP